MPVPPMPMLMASKSASPPLWSPSDVAGLQVWFDPDDPGYRSLDGSSPPNILTLTDKVASRVASGVVGDYCDLIADGVNGHDVLEFTSTGSTCRTSSPFAFYNATDKSFTIAVSYRCPSSVAALAYLYRVGDDVANYFGVVADASAGGTFAENVVGYIAITHNGVAPGGVLIDGGFSAPDDAWHVAVLRYDGTTSQNLTLRIDGSLVDTATINLPDAFNSYVGYGIALGCGPGVRILDYLIYDSDLVGTDLSDLETYLIARVGGV